MTIRRDKSKEIEQNRKGERGNTCLHLTAQERTRPDLAEEETTRPDLAEEEVEREERRSTSPSERENNGHGHARSGGRGFIEAKEGRIRKAGAELAARAGERIPVEWREMVMVYRRHDANNGW